MKIYMRDIIALLVLGAGFLLIWAGHNSFIHTCIALVIGYYFSKRVYEENNNGRK